jgi:NAD(P)H-dependent flavin oxidoreductase YrpB (nitropropane dioxygenase family)
MRMTLSTAFTEMFGIRHPIALAPMGGSAGGALAAAVSNGGGLGHPFLDRWRDAEAELAADPGDVRRAYRDGIARGELPAEPVWASQAIGLIRDLPPAAELVGVLAADARQALSRALAG